jgi:hypothetical protein
MRKTLLTLISSVALSALVACGGGSSNSVSVPPAPAGGNNAGFSNASLTGNYVFAVHGTSLTNEFAVAGVLTADGNGNISGMRDTVNDGGGQTLAESITGTYSVNQDGRGQVILNGRSGQVIYRFALQSPTSVEAPVVGKLFQDSTTSNNVTNDAVGTIEAQSTPATTLAGSYVVRLDGEDSGKSVYGAVGGLSFTGGTFGGTIDENDSGTVNALLGISSGTYSLTTTGRGTLAYVTPASTAVTPSNAQGTHNFIAYYVAPSRVELISTDPRFFLHGYADMQTSVSANNAAFTGGQVFSLAGFDSGGPRVETGRLTLDGAGNLTSAIEDYNTAANYFSGVSLPGSTYSVGAAGRWTANLVNPTAASTTGLVGWQVSPLQSLLLTTSPNILETGTMRAQTASLSTLSNASVTGNYAQEFSGFNSNSQSNLELTGNLLADGAGNLSGTYDSQSDVNGLSLDIGTTGTYTIDPTLGRSTNGNIDGLPVVLYTVDANTMYFISAQQFNIYQGMLVSQH